MAAEGLMHSVRTRWRRLPRRWRGRIPAVILIALGALYPVYVDSLPTGIPIVRTFPSVDTSVFIIIFVIMAVGLKVVVG